MKEDGSRTILMFTKILIFPEFDSDQCENMNIAAVEMVVEKGQNISGKYRVCVG